MERSTLDSLLAETEETRRVHEAGTVEHKVASYDFSCTLGPKVTKCD